MTAESGFKAKSVAVLIQYILKLVIHSPIKVFLCNVRLPIDLMVQFSFLYCTLMYWHQPEARHYFPSAFNHRCSKKQPMPFQRFAAEITRLSIHLQSRGKKQVNKKRWKLWGSLSYYNIMKTAVDHISYFAEFAKVVP